MLNKFNLQKLINIYFRYKYNIDKSTKLGKINIFGNKEHIKIYSRYISNFNRNSNITSISQRYSSKIELAKNSFIRDGVKIEAYGKGLISVGENTTINENSILRTMGKNSIIIGKNSIISWNCQILSSDFHQIIYDGVEKYFEKDILISDNCWIGTNVTILKGSRIRKGSVVQANSLVCDEFPENSLIGGVPAKLIKKNVSWRNLLFHEKRGEYER